MFEVVGKVLDVDEQRLNVGPQGPRKDIGGKTIDIASKIRMLNARGMTIDFDARSRLASRRTLVDNEV